MLALLLKALAGTSVGVLVGLTGLGSGVLLLPILIFGLGIPPIVAVGSDAAFSAATKFGAGVFHWRQGTVSWKMVQALVIGSIPGAIGGVLLLANLRVLYGNGVNDILRYIIGVLLVCIPLLLLFQGTSRMHALSIRQLTPASWIGVSLIGLVGTDIVHAVILTGFTTLLYLRLGTVDFGLVMALLVGSIPGALIGVRLSTRLPSPWLKRVLCLALLATGVRMLLV